MNKKIVFDDDGEAIAKSNGTEHSQNRTETKSSNEYKNFNGKHKKRPRQFNKIQNINKNKGEESVKWFEKYSEYNNNLTEVVELKDQELNELTKLCKNSFESELPRQIKKNPGDAKWLETALHKGTAKDRANSGALLVQSNPLANLPALQTLIGLSKHSNKVSSDVIMVLTDLFIEALLPSNRKLLSLALRGHDWKILRKSEDVTDSLKTEIYAYWHFENELKDYYFDFLKNLQQGLQTGQDANKNIAIISATRLLTYGPEKEQLLLSMLINKLGDPSNKVASKALHHLTELVYRHPNMSGVITSETEKLLFRNNISERAQHFALSYLSQIAPRGQPEVCTKLVNICFAFFKILVQKGAINNKTMQAILRCLQKSIIDAKPSTKDGQIMTKEMQDTIYRLVHLADIKISIQTLSLLLQLITVKSENSDRFYNALYKKLLDLNLTTIGYSTTAQFLHILHKAIYLDQNISRSQAFIKRLLQLSLYMPSQMACGTLIIVNKLLKMKPELSKFEEIKLENPILSEEILKKFEYDGEEKYKDVQLDTEEQLKNEDDITFNDTKNIDENVNNIETTSSWYHVKNDIKKEQESKEKISQIVATSYNPYHRVPAYAGAEYAQRYELLLLVGHFHPTVKVFTENILNNKKIDYYGDPLKDFGLSHFLERFAFKNPKKIGDKNTDSVVHMLHNKDYLPHGARGQPVKSLTKVNCTEDELFIFNYLEKKRENQAKIGAKSNDDDEIEDVDDDEFENYLDSLCKKSGNTKDEEDGVYSDDNEEAELDYLKELSNDFQENKVKNKNKRKKVDEEGDDEESDVDLELDDEDVQSEDEMDINEEDEDDDEIMQSDLESIGSLDENESGSEIEEDSLDDDEHSEDEEPKRKKSKMSGPSFSKMLKNQTDMSSLFAAADDFAELLEDTGKIKGHGTLNAVFNKDKSSDKQLKWEEKRRSNMMNFKNNNRFKKTGKIKSKK